MYDGPGFAILLGVGLGIFALVGFLLGYVLLRHAQSEKLLKMLRGDERILYLLCVHLLSRADWDIRCPHCEADLLCPPTAEEAEEAEAADFEDTR